MARLVSIDYGNKRTGLAVSDPLGLIATPLRTLPPDEVISFLQTYLAKEPVKGMVIGYPLSLDGSQNTMTRRVQQFTRLLKRYFPQVPIFHFDERLTSSMAKQALWDTGSKKKKRQNRSLLDAISATFILRSFLVPYQQGRVKPLSP